MLPLSKGIAHFTKHQIAGAEKARTLQASLSFPSQHDFKWILQSNQIVDCPVMVQDAKIAYRIWGPNIAELKGKATQKTPTSVELDIVQIPKEIRELHHCVSLSVDIFFVNNIPFLITLSRNVRFTTVTHLSDRLTQTIFKALRGIVLYYFQKGFQIIGLTADGEFASLQECMVELPGAPKLNLTSANKHEPYIERRSHVVKERVRSLHHSLPLKQLPKQITIYIVFYAVKLLNYFPMKGGVSDQYSPKDI